MGVWEKFKYRIHENCYKYIKIVFITKKLFDMTIKLQFKLPPVKIHYAHDLDFKTSFPVLMAS